MRTPISFEQLHLLPYTGKWLVRSFLIACLAGTASAVFLHALDWATALRETHRTLIWLLPLAGFAVGWCYLRMGRPVEAGNNLIIDEIHDPKKTIPLRMVPLVFGGTVISHLFGASVGREGTAVQMGGALADQLARIFRLSPGDRSIMLMTGIAAGFSSIFGTPLAGAIFGLEVLAIGRLRYDALLPCFVSAIAADRIGLLLGAQHTHYAVTEVAPVTLLSMLSVVVAGILFGVIGMVFANSAHSIGAFMKKHVKYAPLRPFIGGIVVATAVWALDGYRYIGLGIPSIVQAFQVPIAPWDFLGKLAFTVASLGTGFKGGEVTPLFYIGATFGNALAPLLHLPFTMLAGLGFVAVFAGAANTPIATIVMAIELFGPDIAPFAAVACISAYLFSGHTGIYHAQRVGIAKHRMLPEGLRISELRAHRKTLAEQAATPSDK